jgi:hypothetical protein
LPVTLPDERFSHRAVQGARALSRMIGITISAEAYAAIVATLPAGPTASPEDAPDREYRIWVPRIVVNRLRELREPGETFSDVILRLKGSFGPLMR